MIAKSKRKSKAKRPRAAVRKSKTPRKTSRKKTTAKKAVIKKTTAKRTAAKKKTALKRPPPGPRTPRAPATKRAAKTARRPNSSLKAKPYYITTAISYPNGVPHIGHAYEAIATDAIARFMRLDGRDVFFLTGTDEHGIKMLQTANREGVTPRELADRNVKLFREMVKRLNCSNDDFIRTTEPRHHRSSAAIWERMVKAGDIYLSKYSGWDSVRDEAYYDVSETRLDDKGQRAGPQNSPAEWVGEENYFFKLSAYQQKLLDLYARVPDFVLPRERLNEVASFVKGALKALSPLRANFVLRIPVPPDPKDVT